MALHKPFQLTLEQITLSEERKIKKQKNSSTELLDNDSRGAIIERAWIPIHPVQEEQDKCQRIRVFTWNVCLHFILYSKYPPELMWPTILKGRDLFPTSNCLKVGQREHMLYRELLFTQADIMCLQEVDRLDKLLPVLDGAGYTHHYAAGVGKKHGCLIAFKKDIYTSMTTKLVEYDREHIRLDGEERRRCGRSIHTRNIGLLVSLQSTSKANEGIIVATSHLFWHPGYTYERARQAGILIRETAKFRAETGVEHWPCILSGGSGSKLNFKFLPSGLRTPIADFNFAPDDPAYSLIVGDVLLPEQKERLLSSYVVHVSVDPTVPTTLKGSTEEDSVDPDKTITGARPATAADGLLSVAELVDFFSRVPRLRSSYDEGLKQIKDTQELPTFSRRVMLPPKRRGGYEPQYTSYTHYWKTVLDYIFIMDPLDRYSNIISLLSPHRTEDLEPGIPQKGVSSSDHISLAADLLWSPKSSLS